MDNITATLMHYSGVLNGEIVAIGALAVVVVGMFFYREDRKSSKWLMIAVLLEILHLIGDAGTFEYSLYLNLPIWIAAVFYFMAYSFGSLTTIAFAMYVKSYIEERTGINKWVFRVPIILEAITFCVITAAVAAGNVYGIADGKVTAIGSIPIITAIIPMIVIIYIPIAAMTKVKTIGLKAVFVLGLFGIVPGVTMFISYDYSVITAAFALLIVYVLLQCDISAKKEKQRSELAELNAQLEENQAQLEESASEQEAQLEEIAALNADLQENQAKLEEAAAEQEAQLEEITALNAQLESNQAELEASVAEQQTQMEEIQAEREKVSEAYGMIEGLSQDYHTIWIVDKETSRMRLVRSSGKTTIKRAVQMGIDEPEFDPAFDNYIGSCVEPEDRERMHREIAFAEVLRHLSEYPDKLYAVNYLRRDDSGHVSYHQIAFANADTQDGKKHFVYGFRDVDQLVIEEQRQKEELQEALTLAQEASDAMSNAGYGMWHIILKDGVAPRMQVNDKMAELLGISGQDLSEEELYNAWYDQIVPDAIPSVQTSVGEMLAGHFSENTYQWVHPTKGVIWVRCGGTAQKLEDGTNVLSGYHADVTDIVYEEQKHNEELRIAKEDAESANAAKTSFLFNMSHDIRTPMNAIMGFRDLLEKHQEEPERRQDYLNKIHDASTVLLSIINNVLEMARIEKGTLLIDETAWSTEQFNDTLYSVFHVMMEEKGLTFTRQIEVQHHYVYCDPTKLREIFINILSNAYKYTNAGGSVNMHLEEIPCDRDGWVLYRTTISDTGIGMSEEFLPHLFEEFAREQNTTDAKVEGTGLGMPIVKRLVEMLDGTIEVKSKKGEGSTFIVTIPHRIANKANLVDHAGVEIDPKLFMGKRILLAEDNDLNAEIAMEILGEAGFLVDRAEDGRICIDMLEKADPGYYALILMDIQMPNMNGYEATKAIRQLDDSDKADIKILAMTANAFEEDKREALKAGMNGHLAKPIDVKELMRTLAGILG